MTRLAFTVTHYFHSHALLHFHNHAYLTFLFQHHCITFRLKHFLHSFPQSRITCTIARLSHSKHYFDTQVQYQPMILRINVPVNSGSPQGSVSRSIRTLGFHDQPFASVTDDAQDGKTVAPPQRPWPCAYSEQIPKCGGLSLRTAIFLKSRLPRKSLKLASCTRETPRPRLIFMGFVHCPASVIAGWWFPVAI